MDSDRKLAAQILVYPDGLIRIDMLVFHVPFRFVRADRDGGHIEWSVDSANLFEHIAIASVAGKEKLEFWSLHNPTAPQGFVVIGKCSLAPMLCGSEDE